MRTLTGTMTGHDRAAKCGEQWNSVLRSGAVRLEWHARVDQEAARGTTEIARCLKRCGPMRWASYASVLKIGG